MNFKQFKFDLNNLPEEIRHKVYSNLIDKMDIVEHKNKFKLTLNLINKKRHNIYKNLNYYNYIFNDYIESAPLEILNYNEELVSYLYVCYSDVYISLRGFTKYMNKKNQNGYYKKYNPSDNDETYYKLKYRYRKNKNHYNRNRNKYSIKDMKR